MDTSETNPTGGEGAPEVENPNAAPVTETPAPSEGEAPAPAEGEQPAAAEKPPEIPEETLKAAAEKYAAAKVQAANKTMAAARRAEKASEAVKTENASLKTELGEYKGFVEQLHKDPDGALKRVGFATVKAFVDHVLKVSGEAVPAAETVEERLARIEAEGKERSGAAQKLAQEAAVAESKRKVFAAVDNDKRFDLVTTDVGHNLLWEAIEAYHAQHGSCPDEAVYALADRVEKHLETNVSKTRKFSGQRPAATQNGATPAAQAANAGTKGGNTLTNSSTAGTPATRVYSLDPEERRRQVNEDMRAAGELT